MRVRRLMKGPCQAVLVLPVHKTHAQMGKKSLRAKKWFGRGGHQRYAGRPVDVDLQNTTTRASEVTTRDLNAILLNEQAGTFTRASEETLRQRRIVSGAGRLKGRARAATQGHRIKPEDMEAYREKVAARRKEVDAEVDAIAAHRKILLELPDAAKIEQLTDETRPRAIEVALANVKAAFDAIPPHQHWSDYEPGICGAIVNLRETILIDKDDRADFDEYMDGLSRSEEYTNKPADPELLVTTIACWPRFRKHWPRMRRRICSYCGKRSDLGSRSPRFLVCGGCGEGRGVGRYCSEDCQRAHWPEHRKVCPILHIVLPECRTSRKMKNIFLRGQMKKAMKNAGFARSPEEAAEIRAEMSQE